MRTFSTTEAAELLNVSTETVRRWCDEGRLTAQRDSGGNREIRGSDLASHLTAQPAAFDAGGSRQSARNRFTGIVTKVETDRLTALVEIYAGGHRILSMMTREAVEELQLEPGDLATAVVKSTNVVVESALDPKRP